MVSVMYNLCLFCPSSDKGLFSYQCFHQFVYEVLLNNILNPRVKPWVMQKILTFDSMDGLLNYDHSFVMSKIVSILDFALPGVKGRTKSQLSRASGK